MSDIAIRVDHLSKQYRIGAQQAPYRTLREALVKAARRPIDWLKGERKQAKNTFWALDDVSFEIKQGEAVGIIGRNGAGKSTLLKVLSRITRPTRGRVEIFGRVGSLLEVGTGFHPELTGRENIYLNGAILGMGRQEIMRKFDEIVAFAEVEKFLDTPVKFYSSGMYVRLAFAVAAHLDPEILIVDEVLAVGDAAFQKKCIGKMEDISKNLGRTVIFVSHNINAIEQLCNSCMIIEKGSLKMYSKDVRNLITNYLHLDDKNTCKPTWVDTNNQFSNPYFKPLRFMITDEKGKQISMPVKNDQDYFIYIEFDVEQSDNSLTVGYALYNEDGTLLFWTYHSDVEEQLWPSIKKGKNIIISQFPKHFLNEGMYRIDLLASLHFRKWILEPGKDVPQIFLSINGGLSDSPYWMARRPGALAPIITWKRL